MEKKRKHNLLSAAFCLILVGQSITACGHIEANGPDAKDFRTFLVRDLNSYFGSKLQKSVNVEYELLRNGPTQTGIAWPKYYAWVRVYEGSKLIDQGAVRLAAVRKTEFGITDFVSKTEIRKDAQSVRRIFPAALSPAIVAKANE